MNKYFIATSTYQPIESAFSIIGVMRPWFEYAAIGTVKLAPTGIIVNQTRWPPIIRACPTPAP